jgi:hypothetical protein
VPLAGAHDGVFYLRDEADNWRLYLGLSLAIDGRAFLGPGVSAGSLKPTLMLRRVRPEISGELGKRWQFMLAADFGQTSLDNPLGTDQTSAAPVGVDPSASSGRYASAQTAAVRGGPTDVFVNYRLDELVNLELGQFAAPFMLENRTRDAHTPFLERSLAVRVLGIPTHREIGLMVWGAPPDQFVHYEAGVFNGDGPNRLNVDDDVDAMGRVFLRPLASVSGTLRGFQVGTSLHYGIRDAQDVLYDYPAMTTQGGFVFQSPVYAASNGWVHVIPSGRQAVWAAELFFPFYRFDLTGEIVFVKNNTREALEGAYGQSLRRGDLSGRSHYLELGWWPLGRRELTGVPGLQMPTQLDLTRPPPADSSSAVELLIRWEQLAAAYQSASRSGEADANNMDGDIRVNVWCFGVNYWASRQVRLSMNYLYYGFPDSAPPTPSVAGGPSWSSAQRAAAPGNTLPVGVDDLARDQAHSLHELSLRIGVSL